MQVFGNGNAVNDSEVKEINNKMHTVGRIAINNVAEDTIFTDIVISGEMSWKKGDWLVFAGNLYSKVSEGKDGKEYTNVSLWANEIGTNLRGTK